jgi:hypothetical protein
MEAISGAEDSVFIELCVHWSFVSKYRRRVLNTRAIDVLLNIFAEVCVHTRATLVAIDGEDDYVHLLIHNASLSALSFPGLKAEACRAFWSSGTVEPGDGEFVGNPTSESRAGMTCRFAPGSIIDGRSRRFRVRIG